MSEICAVVLGLFCLPAAEMDIRIVHTVAGIIAEATAGKDSVRISISSDELGSDIPPGYSEYCDQDACIRYKWSLSYPSGRQISLGIASEDGELLYVGVISPSGAAARSRIDSFSVRSRSASGVRYIPIKDIPRPR